jgi:hypothetical protein
VSPAVALGLHRSRLCAGLPFFGPLAQTLPINAQHPLAYLKILHQQSIESRKTPTSGELTVSVLLGNSSRSSTRIQSPLSYIQGAA